MDNIVGFILPKQKDIKLRNLISLKDLLIIISILMFCFLIVYLIPISTKKSWLTIIIKAVITVIISVPFISLLLPYKKTGFRIYQQIYFAIIFILRPQKFTIENELKSTKNFINYKCIFNEENENDLFKDLIVFGDEEIEIIKNEEKRNKKR
ncbi:hypothetical protein SCORR_v1c10280 (plasmid) [Spiroplasma corruscae]|uniref:PrgI family protein n=1 Tax=Spiroplasma corruscae TaxID=216934 RepID=A0A222EQJ9_9MOLU|nr:hypothetical protein [Spiroplasma corruscae]ASP28800.1 hypothetical protein SCORR_v1c10280 [Spiroplasma corruscae]